ncbi:MAG: R3H domain-containing nucleic acid-binding protein [Geodermatophilaceae bacterium]
MSESSTEPTADSRDRQQPPQRTEDRELTVSVEPQSSDGDVAAQDAGRALLPSGPADSGSGDTVESGSDESVDPERGSAQADLGEGASRQADEELDSSELGLSKPTEQGEADEAPITGEALLVQEGEIAGDYLEQLLDILDYDGDIDLDVEGSRAVVAIVGANDLDSLVGPRGVTLDALQELTRLTVAQQTGVRTRLMLDVGGYRAGRRTELSELAATTVTRVIDSGETARMSPMNAFERKVVHDVVTATDGVRSESEGEDPDRRVVILPDR